MPKRSVRITLYNYTNDSVVTLLDPGIASNDPCGGNWTDGGWRSPLSIPANGGSGGWQSESAGILTGTEGWVKYLVNDKELVYIHWKNPFVWRSSVTTKGVVDLKVVTDEDQEPPCQIGDGIGVWNFPSHAVPTHDLFLFDIKGTEQGGVTWFDAVFSWPVLVLLTVVTDTMDVNLEFKIGLRLKGSVGQTIRSLGGGNKSLRFLAKTGGKSSIRKLFNF